MAHDRWQYQVVEMKYKFMTFNIPANELQEQLNKLGQIGWELVQVVAIGTTLRLFLKRPL